MGYDKINIAEVNDFCSALRERIKCSVREAKTFAKDRKTIRDLLNIYQQDHNLIDTKYGKTPYMTEGITSFTWSWGRLLNVKVSMVK